MAINLQTIGIIVSDMAKTLSFYRTLGLPIPEGLEKEDNVDFEAPNGITFGFLTEEAARHADPNFKMPTGQSMNLQFMADSPAEVDEVYNKLTAAGHESYAEPWDAFWGQRFRKGIRPGWKSRKYLCESIRMFRFFINESLTTDKQLQRHLQQAPVQVSSCTSSRCRACL